MSVLLGRPISALLLELGHILVTLLNRAELVGSLLVGRVANYPLLPASFPGHVEGLDNCF